MKLHSLNKFLYLLFSCWGIYFSAQYTIPEKPNILYPVYDEAKILSTTEREKLNQKLIKFEDSTSTEIEVIIIPSTKGEDINFLATQFGQKWGIGKNKVDNGVVFLIAIEDRTISIQQGRAIEQYLTASVAGQIIDYLVVPHFKQNNWYLGIDSGTDAIIEALQGKFKPKRNEKDSSAPFNILIIGIIIFIIIVVLISNKNNNGGFGENDFDDIILSRRGRSSYSKGFHSFPPSFGSRNSSGGFGGFGGGGSFGGGGASGSW